MTWTPVPTTSDTPGGPLAAASCARLTALFGVPVCVVTYRDCPDADRFARLRPLARGLRYGLTFLTTGGPVFFHKHPLSANQLKTLLAMLLDLAAAGLLRGPPDTVSPDTKA